MANYLQTSNPFCLPRPPAWWLRALADFDQALVVFPSVIQRIYILGRRRGFTNRAAVQPLVTLNNNLVRMTAGLDGDVLATHNLVYVDKIIGWGVWTNAIFNQLRARDTWRVGGGAAYADLVEQQEAQERLKRHATRSADWDHRMNDFYRSWQARTGQRTKVTIPSQRKSTSSSTAGSGLVQLS